MSKPHCYEHKLVAERSHYPVNVEQINSVVRFAFHNKAV